ncbi:hypothetical protein FRC09_012681, partial [Ceratobasidium sp. 395]
MPVRQPSPVQAIVDFLEADNLDSDNSEPHSNLRRKLALTSAGYLVSNSPVDAKSAELPSVLYKHLPPISSSIHSLAEADTLTELKQSLQGALQDLIERDQARDSTEQALTA